MTRQPFLPFFFFSVVFFSTNARAQNDADLELAKRHFELGKTYYAQAAYKRALEAFQESHKLSGKPALLFNIGKCHEALGNLKEAITFYRQYLDATGKKDTNTEARIKNLESRIAAQKPEPPPEPVPKPAPSRTAPSARPVPPAPPPRTEEPTFRRRGVGWMTITGWSLVGLGAASLATGIAMGALAKGRASEVEDAYKDNTHDWADIKDTEQQGKRFNIGMIVGISVGVVAAGGGAALLILAPRQERRVSVSPLFDGESIGMTAALRY
jgi:tetratricopeptide (TPR) repeat protein